jgi:tetratricopeptide (TPR) repeat protein
MIEASQIDSGCQPTDGAIAVNNLESACQRSWNRFWFDPLRPGIAEQIVEQEQLKAQFLGDLSAFDRLEILVNHLDQVDGEAPRTTLLHAQVASLSHRFSEARSYLSELVRCGDSCAVGNRLLLSIDQACGTNLDVVLEARRGMAAESERLEDLVPLGALHADLREFDEADRIYQKALRAVVDTSPFAVAWVCFQLGTLWGELVPEAHLTRAAFWYRKAIQYLPQYVKAHVHLAEIYSKSGNVEGAEAILVAVVARGDPEVSWRLADLMVTTGRYSEAEELMKTARSQFEILLKKHLLAFADHAAEFYSGSGNDPRRAFELSCLDLANRPTLRAFERAYATALAVAEAEQAAEILLSARDRWGTTPAFRLSPLQHYLP